MIRTITKPALAAISTAANIANKSTVFNDMSCCDDHHHHHHSGEKKNKQIKTNDEKI